LIIVGVGAAGYWWWRISLSTNAAVEKTSKDTNENARDNEGHPTSGNKQAEISSKPMNAGTEIDKGTPVRDDTRVAPSQHLKSRAGTEPTFSAETGAPNVSQEQGLRELQTARTYLEGRGVPKDATVAAQWLWKAVAKQNTEATIMLSQMYASGDGVHKNCDQARLLLAAAAQRGSNEARESLKDVISKCR
jgi:TPR repeat protein